MEIKITYPISINSDSDTVEVNGVLSVAGTELLVVLPLKESELYTIAANNGSSSWDIADIATLLKQKHGLDLKV